MEVTKEFGLVREWATGAGDRPVASIVATGTP